MALAMPAINLSAQTAFRDSVELNPIVVTASHTPKTLKDAPVVTRLITLRDIKIVDATNIQDMLTQELPGLEFGFAMSQETSLNMSGFGGNAVLFLVDGERLAGETMDNTDYNRLNLDNVGRIEIVKGASSALYGSNAVGGVVNIISRENLEPWTANANTRYNTFGHEWRNGVSFSFNTEKWNSQTSFQHTMIDPVDLPKAHTSEEIALELMKKAQGLPYDESVLNDDSNLNRLYGQKTYNVKERLTWRATDQLTLVGRGGYFFRTSERDTHDYHFHGYSAGLKGRYAWDHARHLELSYAYDQYDKANFQPNGTRTHDHDYSTRQHVVHALYSHSLGKNSLILGADYLHDYLTTYQFLDNASHAQDNIDGYAQFDWNITPQLNIVGSVRYDYFSASSQKAFTERLAVVYKQPWMTFRANYASGFPICSSETQTSSRRRVTTSTSPSSVRTVSERVDASMVSTTSPLWAIVIYLTSASPPSIMRQVMTGCLVPSTATKTASPSGASISASAMFSTGACQSSSTTRGCMRRATSTSRSSPSLVLTP